MRASYILEIPNVLEAFLARIGGQSINSVAPHVDNAVRLLPNAIRIVDWSHTIGNIRDGHEQIVRRENSLGGAKTNREA